MEAFLHEPEAEEAGRDMGIGVPGTGELMVTIGAAPLAHKRTMKNSHVSQFKGLGVSEVTYHTSSFISNACPNQEEN